MDKDEIKSFLKIRSLKRPYFSKSSIQGYLASLTANPNCHTAIA